jgi:hypothetical protein
MNTYSGTNTDAFKTAVSSVVCKHYDTGSLLEVPNKEEAIKKADNHIKELLNKKIWTAQDAGKICFYDYLISVNTDDSEKASYEQQLMLISKRVKRFGNTYASNEKIYRLYSELFSWLSFVCQRGYCFFKELRSTCIVLKNIIDTACAAENVAKGLWTDMPNEVKFGLCDMMLANVLSGGKGKIDINSRQMELNDAIDDLKTLVNSISYHRVALDTIGGYADIQELKYFSFESSLFVLIDELLSRAEKLEKIISSNDCYGNKGISSKRSQTVRSILIDKLQPKELIPSRSSLIDGACHDSLYVDGFNISVEINNERRLKKT